MVGRVGSCLFMLSLAVTVCLAQSVYSDAASDGATIYGWAVTDDYSNSYHHQNDVGVYLSSPNGRTASGSANGAGTVRADVSLSVIEDGDYLLESYHTGYCDIASSWYFAGSTSLPIEVALKFTFGQNTGSTLINPNIRQCDYSPACTSGNPPACGAGGITVIQGSEACPNYTYCGFARVRIGGSITCLLGTCQGAPGPGPCDQ
jgi:hypothetical protein